MAAIDIKKIVEQLPASPDAIVLHMLSISEKEINDPLSTERDFALLSALIEKIIDRHSLEIAYGIRAENETWRSQLTYLTKKLNEYKIFSEEEKARKELDREISAIDDLLNKETPFGQAILTPDEKIAIRHRIDKIKELVEKSAVAPRKKRALFSKINNLLNEVDKDGTLTDTFIAFAMDVAMTAKEMHEYAKPIIEDTKDILRIVYLRRAQSEGISLPAPEDFPQLPSLDTD